jgi:hypothetical protein
MASTDLKRFEKTVKVSGNMQIHLTAQIVPDWLPVKRGDRIRFVVTRDKQVVIEPVVKP